MSEVTCSIVDAACMPCTHSQASFCCSVEPPVPRSMVFPPSGAAKKRDLPVHPLPVREQTVPDDDALGVDRAEPHPSGCRRRSACHQAGVVLHWDLPRRSDLGPMAPACRRHGPSVQCPGQLYPFRMVLI